MDEKYKPFYKKIWETKCSRFNAQKRYELMEVRSELAVVLLTSAVLAISIFKVSGQLNLEKNVSHAGDIALVVFSIGLLTLELYIKGRKFSDLAEAYHRSGLEIARVYDEFVLEASKMNPSDMAIEAIVSKYHDALSRGKNHAGVDFERVKYEHPNDYGLSGFYLFAGRLLSSTKYFFCSGGLFILVSLVVCAGTVGAIIKYGFVL